MIEKTLMKYLSGRLKPVPVVMEYPEDRTVPCVIIEKTGSSKYNYIQRATVAFQSVHSTLQKAAELNETVKEAVESMETLPAIGSVSLNSDYNFTDTGMKQYRYQAVYDITYTE